MLVLARRFSQMISGGKLKRLSGPDGLRAIQMTYHLRHIVRLGQSP